MLRWAMARDGAGAAELTRGVAPDVAVKTASIAIRQVATELKNAADTAEVHQMLALGVGSSSPVTKTSAIAGRAPLGDRQCRRRTFVTAPSSSGERGVARAPIDGYGVP